MTSQVYHLTDPDQNHGNFLELLNFRIRAGDLALKHAQHFATAARSATCTNKKQEIVIALLGSFITFSRCSHWHNL